MRGPQECVGGAQRIGGDPAPVGVVVAVAAKIEERIDAVVLELEPSAGRHVSGDDAHRDVAPLPDCPQQRQHPRQQPSFSRREGPFEPLQVALQEPLPGEGLVLDPVLREHIPHDRPIAAPREGDPALHALDAELRAKRLGERRSPCSPGVEQGRIDVEQSHEHGRLTQPAARPGTPRASTA